jgi:hypothetical protein
VTFAPIVKHDQLEQYFEFSNNARGWLEESKKIYDKLQPGENRSSEPPTPPLLSSLLCVDHAEGKEKYYSKVLAAPCSVRSETYLPLLHISPPPFLNKMFFILDFFTDLFYQRITTAASEVSNLVFSHIDMDPRVFDLVFGNEIHSTVHNRPHTLAAVALYDGLNGGRVVGYAFGVVAWERYMSGKNDLFNH